MRVGGGAMGMPEGAERAATEQSAEAPHTADVGQLHVCWAAPRGGWGFGGGWGAGRKMCFALLSSSTTQARLDWS